MWPAEDAPRYISGFAITTYVFISFSAPLSDQEKSSVFVFLLAVLAQVNKYANIRWPGKKLDNSFINEKTRESDKASA